jgi:hypothetical protein
MAKVTTVQFDDSEPSSMKDAAYKAARGGETIANVARYILKHYPDFAEKQSDVAIEELSGGWALRYQELHAAQHYNAEWIPVEKDGMFIATLAFALSYSQQAAGQLKRESAAKHAIVAKLRTHFSKYRSNRLSDIIRAIKQLNPVEKERAPIDNYDAFVKKTLTLLETRCSGTRRHHRACRTCQGCERGVEGGLLQVRSSGSRNPGLRLWVFFRLDF